MENYMIEMIPIVSKIVYKYVGYKDEDLESVGIIGAIKAIKKSVEVDKIEDKARIMARAYVWARNAIIDDLRKKQFEYANIQTDNIYSEEDLEDKFLIEEIANELTPKQKEIYYDLIEGLTINEICNKHNIKKRVYFKHLKNIKQICALFGI